MLISKTVSTTIHNNYASTSSNLSCGSDRGSFRYIPHKVKELYQHSKKNDYLPGCKNYIESARAARVIWKAFKPSSETCVFTNRENDLFKKVWTSGTFTSMSHDISTCLKQIKIANDFFRSKIEEISNYSRAPKIAAYLFLPIVLEHSI